MAVIASSYPTFFLTGFHPVEGIKGKSKSGLNGRTFRNTLVVIQFSVSIILIASTAIVFQQLKYVSEKDLGFDKENLLVVNNLELLTNAESLTEAAKNISGVISTSQCTSVPPRIWAGDKFSAEGMNNQSFALNYTTGDENYVTTLGIKMKVGRNFHTVQPSDYERVILNETAVSRIGWAADESVIGKKISSPDGEITFEVIGIMEDFHFWSLENPIEPMAIFHNQSKKLFGVGTKKYLALRITPQSGDEWDKTLASLGTLWKTHAGTLPFQYEFMDEAFVNTFKTQQQFGKILTVMAALAIMIAALGLLGMIIYSLEQRTKEIGIRKVSGASVLDILRLISKSFSSLILIAFVIATPLAWWLMKNWLDDFAYRITPTAGVFIFTGLSTFAIALLITSYHAVKAAMTNPVDVLKDE
jgi:putative ABC transport system permease protein